MMKIGTIKKICEMTHNLDLLQINSKNFQRNIYFAFDVLFKNIHFQKSKKKIEQDKCFTEIDFAS